MKSFGKDEILIKMLMDTCMTSLYSIKYHLPMSKIGWNFIKILYLSQNEFVKILPIFSKQSTI